MGDPTRIHQVIMNLCTNAYHAMSETGGILGVSLKQVDFSKEDCASNMGIKSGQYLALEISDTGRGMEPALLDKIFNPYFITKKTGQGYWSGPGGCSGANLFALQICDSHVEFLVF